MFSSKFENLYCVKESLLLIPEDDIFVSMPEDIYNYLHLKQNDAFEISKYISAIINLSKEYDTLSLRDLVVHYTRQIYFKFDVDKPIQKHSDIEEILKTKP